MCVCITACKCICFYVCVFVHKLSINSSLRKKISLEAKQQIADCGSTHGMCLYLRRKGWGAGEEWGPVCICACVCVDIGIIMTHVGATDGEENDGCVSVFISVSNA